MKSNFRRNTAFVSYVVTVTSEGFVFSNDWNIGHSKFNEKMVIIKKGARSNRC